MLVEKKKKQLANDNNNEWDNEWDFLIKNVQCL